MHPLQWCWLVCVWYCLVTTASAAGVGAGQQAFDPLANVVAPLPATRYQEYQGTTNSTLRVFAAFVILRFTGAEFIPFTASHQTILIKATMDAIVERGIVSLVGYKEYYPDPKAPEALRMAGPGVEVALRGAWVMTHKFLDEGEVVPTSLWEEARSEILQAFWVWAARVAELGNWTTPEPVFAHPEPTLVDVSNGYILHPVMVLICQLGLSLADGPASLSAQQASVVAAVVQEAIAGGIGTDVQVVGSTRADEDTDQPSLRGVGSMTSLQERQQALVKLEVTLYQCRTNASVASPECEQQVLAAVLNNTLQMKEVRQRLQAAGIQDVVVVGDIIQRVVAEPDNSAGEQQQPWQPWHLDRIDQRYLPLDGRYTATATGSGVHVYIISSGVYDEHEEFKELGDGNSSRVVAEWGYQGLNPLKDCSDGAIWYPFGTFSASLCCGLKLGPAKNATIHSVRFRNECASAVSGQFWSEGGLPAALDLVLSTAERPAVALLDTWWTNSRQGANLGEVLSRLDKLEEANITVVAGAGMMPAEASRCANALSNHPTVLSVAATDTQDQVTFWGPSNSTCVKVFAPSGSMGTGIWGADTSGPSAYKRAVTNAMGAAAVVAGVAAQYLELNPEATPAQVRKALSADLGTHNTVAGPGVTSMTSLLYTNLDRQESVAPEPGNASPDAASSGSASLSVGVIVAISMAGALVLVMGVALFVMAQRRKRRDMLEKPSDLLCNAGAWEVPPGDLEICRRSDGLEWILGKGHSATVYKAVKGGVQLVAVKKMNIVEDAKFKQLFYKEMDMLRFVSRDNNICQFFGACVQGKNVMLVLEYMEGGDLSSALAMDDPGNLQWYRGGKDVMLDVVRGVHFLHSNGLCHRDLKSKNIFLDRFGRAKVGGVGLAELVTVQEACQNGASGSAQARSFAGTLAWAAPEVMLGEPYTEKSDCYSLGVVLWELVTRQTPQRGCLRDVEVPRECPQEVADAIAACMQQDPQKRPTARELYSRLSACAPRPTLGIMESGSSEEPALAKDKSTSISSVAAIEGSKSGSMGSDAQAPVASVPSEVACIDMNQVEFCRGADGRRVQLGCGAYGEVYKAMLDGVQPLAAKFVTLGPDPKTQAAFVREARLLWRLRHRNIVSLSGISICDGQGCLLMEYMEGGSLFQRLNVLNKAGQRLCSWYGRGRQVALDIAQGLHCIHSNRITHFDLKSANVLLTAELTAKVTDVGLSRIMNFTHHSLGKDGLSIMPGTFSYMAPELMLGERCSQSVDIYSFGILLWEICTGNHPIRGGQTPLRVPEDCPEAVAKLYAECTVADPAARPTARELVERLTALKRAGSGVVPDLHGRHSATCSPEHTHLAAVRERQQQREQGQQQQGQEQRQQGQEQQQGQERRQQQQRRQLVIQPLRPGGIEESSVFRQAMSPTVAEHAAKHSVMVSPFEALRGRQFAVKAGEPHA